MNNQVISLNTSWGQDMKMSGYIGDPLYPNNQDYWYQPYIYQPIIKEYYPVYLGNWNEKNKTEQAFKIAKKLVDNKKVIIAEVKDFIELVNIIIETL